MRAECNTSIKPRLRGPQRRGHVKHAFNVVKRLWGFSKVRYRGLAKNTARLFAAFALANLYMVRRQLMPIWEACRCRAGKPAEAA